LTPPFRSYARQSMGATIRSHVRRNVGSPCPSLPAELVEGRRVSKRRAYRSRPPTSGSPRPGTPGRGVGEEGSQGQSCEGFLNMRTCAPWHIFETLKFPEESCNILKMLKMSRLFAHFSASCRTNRSYRLPCKDLPEIPAISHRRPATHFNVHFAPFIFQSLFSDYLSPGLLFAPYLITVLLCNLIYEIVTFAP
jgi:hypothetical protein